MLLYWYSSGAGYVSIMLNTESVPHVSLAEFVQNFYQLIKLFYDPEGMPEIKQTNS